MDESRLVLIPAPRRVERRPGRFQFRNGGQIVLYPPDVRALFGTAQRLCDAILAQAQVSAQVVVGEAGHAGVGGVAVALAIDARQVQEAQGYRLEVDDERISIVGHDAAGVFYGACTLNQLLCQFGGELPGLGIIDYPDYPARGVMLDVSRCKVPTLETLMDLVDLLAGLKINQIQLYTEHTFAYREHPEVWANASPITGQDILKLDAYCRERFVELVPNQNSFGHLRPWLTHPKYNHLAECPDGCESPWGGHSEPFSLNPTDPGSLDLLRSMYDDLLPHFASSLFNVGCDETWDLGKGRSKAVCDERGVTRVYLDFLLQIYQLVKERGRQMMFWGDIILHERDLVPELPEDAIALEWGYEADHPFAERCKQFADAGIPFYVCPGTSSWNAVVSRTDNAMGNLRSAAENGLAHGAVGYLNTNWGDHGHWQYQSTAYLGYAYGAAVSWAYEANAGIDLPSALSLHVFGDATGTMGRLAFDLGNVYKVYERFTGGRIHNASFLVRTLYQDVEELEGRGVDWKDVRTDVFREACDEIDVAMSHLPQARMRQHDAALIRREFANAARLLRHACSLGELKVGLARPEPSGAGQRPFLARHALDLAEDMRAILAEHRALWLARNRVGGLEEGSGAHFQGMIEAYWRIAEELQL